MGVSEDDVINIMGGMEHAGGIKLNDHKRKLKNRFEICRKLGQGTYGKVQLGINKETGQEVAIKTIKKSKIETEADLVRIRREIQIMSSVHHPNIIHIYEVFENKEKMVLVMEIAAGGELYDYLSDRKCLEDNEARRLFRQIAMATFYCHKNNICHRDLKLENILLDEHGGAKIADFGLSNVYDGKNLLSTFCGSPLYASPEIVKGCPYVGPEVDCWSLGVLLYTLVYGAMPFDGSNFKRLVKQITTGDYYEPKKPSSASSLIRGMLTVSSESRATISEICSHWWVNEGYEQSCLEEAECLASLTPVRLDLLLSLNQAANKDELVVRQDEESKEPSATAATGEDVMSIVELPPEEAGAVAGADGMDSGSNEMRVSEPPEDATKSPTPNKRKEKSKRKLTETPSMLDPDLLPKKRDGGCGQEEGPIVQEAMEVCDSKSTKEMPAVKRQTVVTPLENGERSPPAVEVKSTPRKEEEAVSSRPKEQIMKRRASKKEKGPKTPQQRERAPSPELRCIVKQEPAAVAVATDKSSVKDKPSVTSEVQSEVRTPLPSPRPEGHHGPVQQQPARKEVTEPPTTPLGDKTPTKYVGDAGQKRQNGHISNQGISPKDEDCQSNKPMLQSDESSKSKSSECNGYPEPANVNAARKFDSEQILSPALKSNLAEQHGNQSSPKSVLDSQGGDHRVVAPPNVNGVIKLTLPPPEVPTAIEGQQHLRKETPPGSPVKKDQDSSRSLINSIPKPFSTESSISYNDASSPPIATGSQYSNDLFNSTTASPTSSGSNHSILKQQEQQEQQQDADSTAMQGPADKRDSKVIKAAAYWNNYIGDVIAKNKPPENVKSLEKPKKIASAGVGPRGMSDLKNAFENPKPKVSDEKLVIMRRNSKKLNLEGCTPGLKVNDAKSVFEVKNKQPATPSIARRNSVNSQQQPKWVKPKVEEVPVDKSNGELPFGNKVGSSSQQQGKQVKLKVTKASDTNAGNVENGRAASPRENSLKTNEPVATQIEPKNDKKPESNGVAHQKPATSPKPKLKKDTKENVCKIVKDKTAGKGLVLVAPIKVNEALRIVEKSDQGLLPTPLQPEKVVLSAPQDEHREAKSIAADVIAREIFKSGPRSGTPKGPQGESNTASSQSAPTSPYSNGIGLPKLQDQAKSLPTSPDVVVSCSSSNNTKQLLNIPEAPKAPPMPTEAATVTPKTAAAVPKIKTIEVDAAEPQTKLEAVKSSLKRVPHAPAMGKKKEEEEAAAAAAETIDTFLSEGRKAIKDVFHDEAESRLNATSPVVSKPVNTVYDMSSPPLPSSPRQQQQQQNSAAIQQWPDREQVTPKLKSPSEFNKMDRSPNPLPSNSGRERIIPIKVESEVTSLKPPPSAATTRKNEHYIPIRVEGRGTLLRTPDPSAEDLDEAADRLDSTSLSRGRWSGGSRKKRTPGSAYSDSSGLSDNEEGPFAAAAMAGPFSGLQKYSSLGKHGLLDETPMFRLRKIRPPFSVQRNESFSSEGEDDFDDDGFREMTAENLFSTLLSRVKSLTKRIHDEHEQHLSWQQNQRIMNHALNPGNTHARLERSAQRNSLKRSSGASTPVNTYSRQSSLRDDGTSSLRSYEADGGLSSSPATQYGAAVPPLGSRNIFRGTHSDSESLYGDAPTACRLYGNRYDEGDTSDTSGNISVTSKQRLRPGYLPPPQLQSLLVDKNTTKPSSGDFQQHMFPMGSRHVTLERDVPISLSPGSGSNAKSFGDNVYMKAMKPYSPGGSKTGIASADIGGSEGQQQQRRISRFLRPDFNETPKEESIYAKMKEVDDDDRKKSRFLKSVQAKKLSGDVEMQQEQQPEEERRRQQVESARAPPTINTSDSGLSTTASSQSQEGKRAPSSEDIRAAARPDQLLADQLLAQQQAVERKRLKHLQRQFANELQSIEQDILQASINKLKREAVERAGLDPNDLSDGGYLSPPEEDTESVSSDIFGEFDDMRSSAADRQRKRSLLMRLDENSEMGPTSRQPHRSGGTLARPVTRRSISRELFEAPAPAPPTMARPVARRSVSRELFDVNFTPASLSNSNRMRSREMADLEAMRQQMRARETSLTREFDEFCLDSGIPTASSIMFPDHRILPRASSLSRQNSAYGGGDYSSGGFPSRPPLTSQGRSATQNDFLPPSRSSRLPTMRDAAAYDDSSFGRGLDERGRTDWRRISVPERGQDYKSLPRKYNRYSSSVIGDSWMPSTKLYRSSSNNHHFGASPNCSSTRFTSPSPSSSSSLSSYYCGRPTTTVAPPPATRRRSSLYEGYATLPRRQLSAETYRSESQNQIPDRSRLV